MRPLKYAHASFAQIVNHLASPRLCPTKRERNTKSRNRKTKSTKNAEYEVLFVLFVSAFVPLVFCSFPRWAKLGRRHFRFQSSCHSGLGKRHDCTPGITNSFDTSPAIYSLHCTRLDRERLPKQSNRPVVV